MKLIVTILEETFEAALAAIRRISADHDGVELRAEHLPSLDLGALRASTGKLLILTHRGREVSAAAIEAAVAAGIDLIDVEWNESLGAIRYRERVVLSHHDYDAMPAVETLLDAMRARGCAHTKLAVSPETLDDNLRLLSHSGAGVTVIGMGERGLFSRILAPFRGSELAFVAGGAVAAPAQLTLERALEIYGPDRGELRASELFAVAGDPAGHSLSPSIHNPLFRERGADAAYTIASFHDFAAVGQAVLDGQLRGVSVTAPFKEEALAFAQRQGARIAPSAREAGAANTLVRRRDGLLADNTDVDGFESLIREASRRAPLRTAAVIGTGGTARAAVVALLRRGITPRVFGRTARPFFPALEPLDAVAAAGCDLVVNTLPPGAVVTLPERAVAAIDAVYPHRAMPEAACSFTGLDLLRAQAIRQNDIFIEAMN
jgi:3-dehydroquinate dehydratase type I